MEINLDKFDSETRDVITYLKSREEICDLKIEEATGVTNNQLNDWENRNLCCLPLDLKNFYTNRNGLLIEWKVKIDDNTKISLGKIQINSLKDLTKVGSVLSKDYREPSIFDLEDLQTAPNLASFNSISNISAILTNKKVTDLSNDSDEEDVYSKEDTNFNQTKFLIPHFDDLSRNFEIDNCNGYGKVCLVYRNAKPGMMISEQSAEIWYLDRSLQWHFLTNSFKNYYRLAIGHLGLPQWQMLFTEDGLPPLLNQWYYLFAPGRLMIHQENWKKMEFLNLIENLNSNSITNPNNKNKSQSQPNQDLNKKIEFSKLFDEKQAKIKNTSQPSKNIPGSNQNISTSPDKNTTANNIKTRAKLNLNVKK